jgi:quercetin dioxygenase-like cupin family protein
VQAPFKYFNVIITKQKCTPSYRDIMVFVVGGSPGRTRHRFIDFRVVVAFVLGLFLGRTLDGNINKLFFRSESHPPTEVAKRTIRKISSSIQDLKDVPVSSTSHQDAHGNPVTKQQLVQPFLVPNVAGISVATILPGQQVEMHKHETMHEFFYVLEGQGTFFMTGDKDNDGGGRVVRQGSFAYCAPPDMHGITVSANINNAIPMKVLLVGVVVEDT